MANKHIELPLVVIVGPTASGKTGLAIELAERFDGEIICADSRTVYTGMDIGTAKPSQADRARVPHFGLDLVMPGERFSAADFKIYADKKIQQIRARGHIPFLVGGTGLYVDAVIFDYQFGGPVDDAMRQKLQHMTFDELYKYCNNNNVTLPENKNNKRYVIRAIENVGTSPKRSEKPLASTIIVGIATDKSLLRARIEQRTEQLFEDGVVGEATMLGKMYGWDNQAMTSNIYRLVRSYLDGEISLDDAKEKNRTLDWRLAKRQMTWLRRNSFIRWASLGHANDYLSSQLAIYQEP